MNPNHDPDRMLDQALSEYRDAEPLAGMEDRILRRLAAQPARPSHWTFAAFAARPSALVRWTLALAAVAAIIVAGLWLGFREKPHSTEIATDIRVPHSTVRDSRGSVGPEVGANSRAGAPFKPSVGLSGTQSTPPPSAGSPSYRTRSGGRVGSGVDVAGAPSYRTRSGGRVGPETVVASAGSTPKGAPFKPSLGLSATRSTRPDQFPVPVPLTTEEHVLITLALNHPDALLSPPDNADQLSIAPLEIKPVVPESGATQGEPQ